MSLFEDAARRIEQYRICLDRDVDRGLISRRAREPVDACYRTLAALLRGARIEMEGAGTMADPIRDHFVGGCARLALQMYRTTYREVEARRLVRTASALRAEGRRLMEELRARLETAA